MFKFPTSVFFEIGTSNTSSGFVFSAGNQLVGRLADWPGGPQGSELGPCISNLWLTLFPSSLEELIKTISEDRTVGLIISYFRLALEY